MHGILARWDAFSADEAPVAAQLGLTPPCPDTRSLRHPALSYWFNLRRRPGDHAVFPVPLSGLVSEAGAIAANIVGWTADEATKQMRDAPFHLNTNFDHRLGFDVGFLGEAGTEAAGQDYGLH